MCLIVFKNLTKKRYLGKRIILFGFHIVFKLIQLYIYIYINKKTV